MRFSSKLKTKFKNNQVIADAWYSYRKRRNRRMISKYNRIPINTHTVLFSNFNGKGFGCNPRAIAEKVHMLDPDLDLLWVCEDKKTAGMLPDYLQPVLYESNEYFKAMATSKVWVFNELIQDGISKREGQLYIQTYHGDRGFKKVGYDAIDNGHYSKLKRKRKIIEDGICDVFLAGSSYAEKFIRSAFDYHGEVLLEGTPRDDKLLHINEDEVTAIKEKLNLPTDKKILLYAPTFRDTSNEEGKTGSQIDLSAILGALNARGENEWLCLLRAHGGSRLFANNDVSDETVFRDVTKYSDMADLLMITDCLITDYSSSAGDFALTGKPVILYQDDIEEYTSRDRSMYFDMKDSPFWVARNTAEALNLIAEADSTHSKLNDDMILEFYGSVESGHAAETAANRILAFMK